MKFCEFMTVVYCGSGSNKRYKNMKKSVQKFGGKNEVVYYENT